MNLKKNIFSKKLFFDGDSPKTQKVGKTLMTEIQRKNQGILINSYHLYDAIMSYVRVACFSRTQKTLKKYQGYTPLKRCDGKKPKWLKFENI